jgi:cupin 2 domain-containing protein
LNASSPHTVSERYVQEQDEWILILQGQAKLRLDDDQLHLVEADSLLIPANPLHQVIGTSSDSLCIWLAIHMAVSHREAG